MFQDTLLHAATGLATSGLRNAWLIEEREAIVRARDEFLAMLGHELRNPLAPIVTALPLIAHRGGSATTRELEIIGRQVGQLTRIVDAQIVAAPLLRMSAWSGRLTFWA